ncbi:MAG: sugar transferase, partial [Candidatus Eremiobacteraeota bacterium]|nr:sugar transferase [Candidatus Eremiobacteraeota bacterium]
MQIAIGVAVERHVPEMWWALKRTTDVVLGVILLLVAAPIIAAAAVAIAFTTRGTPFFAQE